MDRLILADPGFRTGNFELKSVLVQFIIFFSVKDQAADCIIMTDETCPNGSWHTMDADNKLCSNVRCVGVIRVIAKFGAKPQAFPYDIQKPNLEIKSKNYPSSMVKER